MRIGNDRAQVLDAALVCIDEFYERMFRDWPDAVNRSNGRYALSFSGDTTLSGANHLWPRVPGAVTRDLLDVAERFFRDYGANWTVIYADVVYPELTACLAERGYVTRWTSPLMVRLDVPPPEGAATGFDIIRATTPRHLHDIRRVMADAFMTGHSVNDRVVRRCHLDDPAVTHYLVRVGGEPASCATVTYHHGLASIWNVATRRRFRRQGLARALMEAILRDIAAAGYAGSTLLASTSGRPLYEQLGYAAIGSVHYVGPPLRTDSRWR